MRGLAQLEADVSALQAAVADCAAADLPFGSLSLINEGCMVSFAFRPEEGTPQETVRVTFSDVHKYPRTATRLACDNPTVEATLSILADGGDASLPLLLENLCDLYGIEAEQLFRNLPRPDDEGENDDSSTGNDNIDGSGSDVCHDDEDMDDASSDGQAGMAELEDRELTIAVANCTSTWERYEAEHAEANKGATLSMEQGKAAEKQIFAPAESFQMLSKELRTIVRDTAMGKADIAADAVGNDVYTWQVSISGFSHSSRLGKDLARLKETHGYGVVEVRVAFTRGLHPFYPPKVELVRPRMPLAVVCALASHPLLSLERWDPWKPCLELLKDLRTFLEGHGSVEVDSPLNSMSEFPLSAYTPIERQLVALEGVSTEPPRAATVPQYAEMYRLRDAQVKSDAGSSSGPVVKRLKGPKAEKHFWAAGTGYGTSHATEYSNVWDRQRTLSAQAARDRQMESLLSKLTSALRCLMPEGTSRPAADECSEDDADMRRDTELYLGHVNTNTIWAELCHSCLVPLLAKELSETSFSDMGTRCEYYTTCFRASGQLVSLYELWGSASQGAEDGIACMLALQMAVTPLVEQARFFLQVVNKGRDQQSGKRQPAVASQAGTSHAPPTTEPDASEGSLMELAQLIESTHSDIGALQLHRGASRSTVTSADGQRACGDPSRLDGETNASTSKQPSAEAEPDSDVAVYCRELKDAQVECGDFSKEFQKHHYLSVARSEFVPSPLRISKLGREIAALKSMLPLHPSSSIFVRVDEENSMLWRALITGPEDTPYSYGCFVFDIYFPGRYPDVPPNVNLQTTGGGTVRFNPNLYNDGKVCLSLLGTWDGHKSETWDSKVSSIVQVLVSIQSLIFVPDPFFNEPGYEKGMGKADSQRRSEQYNLNIRLATLQYAILAQLQKPPKEFAEVVRKHMRLQRPKVLSLCEEWLKAANEESAEGAAGASSAGSEGFSVPRSQAAQRMQTTVEAIKIQLELLMDD